MKFVVSFAAIFGTPLSDGATAVDFRVSQLNQIVAENQEIIFDFTGVTNANSSFINALIGGLVKEKGSVILNNIEFKGCKPAIQVLIQSALYLGLQGSQEEQKQPTVALTSAL